MLLVKSGKETFLSQRSDESDESGGELANEDKESLLGEEKRWK